jgi:hypothetical protein
MSFAERATTWNRWYDNAPAEWRFQFVLWSLIALGTLNMMLTLAIGFPFALLVLLGIIVIAAVRVPYVLGLAAEPSGLDTGSRFQIDGADWLIDLNHRYDALPETRRIWVFPAVLLIAGAINMMLTIRHAFPFGLLFLLGLLVLVLFRAPYAAGYLRPAKPVGPPEPEPEFPPVAYETDQPPAALLEAESLTASRDAAPTPAAPNGTDPLPPVPEAGQAPTAALASDQSPATPGELAGSPPEQHGLDKSAAAGFETGQTAAAPHGLDQAPTAEPETDQAPKVPSKPQSRERRKATGGPEDVK